MVRLGTVTRFAFVVLSDRMTRFEDLILIQLLAHSACMVLFEDLIRSVDWVLL